MSDAKFIVSEDEAMIRLYAWKQYWKRGGDMPPYSEPAMTWVGRKRVWHSHTRFENGQERGYWPECGCRVSVPG